MIPTRDEDLESYLKIPENDGAADPKDALPKISVRDPQEGTCI